MKLFNKKYWLIGISLFFPLFALAQYTVPVTNEEIYSKTFGAGDKYTLTGTLNGKVSSASSVLGADPKNPSVLVLNGVDPNATVTFKLSANQGNQQGLILTVKDSNTNDPIRITDSKTGQKLSSFSQEVTLKASDLKDVTIGAEVLKQSDSLFGPDISSRESAGSFVHVQSDAGVPRSSALILNNDSDMPQDPPADAGSNGSKLPENSTFGLPFMNSGNSSKPSDPPASGSGGATGAALPGSNSSGTTGTNKRLVPCDGVNCTIEKLKDLAGNIYNYIAGFGSIVAVGVIVLAGFSYITAAGDAAQMKEAKQKIYLAIVGLVILGTSVLLVNTILQVFKADVTSVESIQSK
jgi:hypothetical protein